MTYRISHTEPAPPGSRFAADAFAGQIGKRLPFDGRRVGACTVLAATIAPGGRSVELTLEVPDNSIPRSDA